jgi:hypothetical protein
MYQYAFLARRRIVDEPRFLELQPFLVGEVVEFVFHFILCHAEELLRGDEASQP